MTSHVEVDAPLAALEVANAAVASGHAAAQVWRADFGDPPLDAARRVGIPDQADQAMTDVDPDWLAFPAVPEPDEYIGSAPRLQVPAEKRGCFPDRSLRLSSAPDLSDVVNVTSWRRHYRRVARRVRPLQPAFPYSKQL